MIIDLPDHWSGLARFLAREEGAYPARIPFWKEPLCESCRQASWDLTSASREVRSEDTYLINKGLRPHHLEKGDRL